MEKYKCILSLRVAKELIAEDHELIDIQPSHRRPGKLVFVFRNSEGLENKLTAYQLQGSK
ncbi:hypothetical protein [Jeotgalibacillus aurantiacus]|uniref:hypothetical protein n=1 Tax=Jeotgalibacillus aurantiacus TaxID=2763266 RepID=UPI001D0BD85F|nr:hypothetical protein [Jeotgalibacillus aurantiacus]